MKRTIIVYGFLISVLIILVFRTYQIMIIDGEKYSDAAKKQQQILINTDNGRGNIYDRNLVKFTSSGKKKRVLLVKSKDPDKDFELCMKLDADNPYRLYNELYKNNIAFCDVDWNFNSTVLNDYKNAFAFEDTLRYHDDGIASAVIGYTSDGKGVSGIEYIADRYLRNGDSGIICLSKDAYGNLLYGISFEHRKNHDGLLLKTTLDKKYSEICQKALEGKNGAVVLLSVPEFDLISMVSSPTFNNGEIKKYLGSEDKPLVNRAVSDYDMGSVFKIIVAAAALENDCVKQDEKFYCNGVKNVKNVSFLCKNHEYLEHMSLNDAFINSCNSVFIDIGRKTSYNNIIDTAYAFGLNEKLIHPLSFPQSAGVLPDKNNYYLADEANLSIGQGKLLGTAVHVANFSAIIASGGVKNKINILDSLLDFKGNSCVDLKEYGEQRVLSENVSDIISDMMRDTVENGTGISASSDYVLISGKTGSAQTGMIENNEPLVHAWFTGFFPSNNPEYAMCVFIENGKSGGSEAAPVFREIAEKIAISEGW